MIKIIKNNIEIEDLHRENKGKSIGLIPTMGNLHQGHLSLIWQSLLENDISIISIYVNPTQFGQGEDLEKYPRTLKQDIFHIEAIKKEYEQKKNQPKRIYVYHPSCEQIYPDGFSDYISIEEFNDVIEGEVRPTHFDGVATVVKRLFNIIKPERAYFGKKDYQQLRLVERLVEQYCIKVKIIGMPIVREKDGLAMSSRNLYLDANQREQALFLNKKLNELSEILLSKGFKAANNLACEIKKNDKRFNYLEIRTQKDLKRPDINNFKDTNLVLLGNLQIGDTRLLDNIEVSL